MTLLRIAALAAAFALSACAAAQSVPVDAQQAAAPSIASATAAAGVDTAAWTRATPPVPISAGLYYVGTAGLSSFLITTPQGHILIDGGMPENAPLIEASIAAAGFNIRDVRYLLNSHAHFDHAGGLAQLKADSGAQMVASAGDKPALEAGRVDYGPSADTPFPAVRVDRVIGDGETVTLGGVTLTAHLTPGHTRGCTTWTMPVTNPRNGERGTALFHCSTTVAGALLVPPSYPGQVDDFRATFKAIREMNASIFLSNHAEFFDLKDKSALVAAGETNAFWDYRELQIFNTRMEEAFEMELSRQMAARR